MHRRRRQVAPSAELHHRSRLTRLDRSRSTSRSSASTTMHGRSSTPMRWFRQVRLRHRRRWSAARRRVQRNLLRVLDGCALAAGPRLSTSRYRVGRESVESRDQRTSVTVPCCIVARNGVYALCCTLTAAAEISILNQSVEQAHIRRAIVDAVGAIGCACIFKGCMAKSVAGFDPDGVMIGN